MYHNSFLLFVFYVTVALVYAKSGHMYHKNLITFSSYMASFFSGDFYFLHAYAIIIPFVYLVYLPRMMAPQTSYFVCRYQTRYQYFRYQYWTVLCFTCYLLPFTYFREESICLHRSDFVIWIFFPFFIFFLSVDCGFFVLYGNLLHSANIKQLHSYPVRFTWSMSFMLHADFSLQNKQQLFPSSSELPGSHSLYGAPPVCYCMLLWLASAYISCPSFVSGIFANK